MNAIPNQQGNQARQKQKYIPFQYPQEEEAAYKLKEVWESKEQCERYSNQEKDQYPRLNEQQQYPQQQFQQKRMNNNQYYQEQQYQQQNGYIPRWQQQQYQQNKPRANLPSGKYQFPPNNTFGPHNRYNNNNQQFVEKSISDQPFIQGIFAETFNRNANMSNQINKGYQGSQGFNYQNIPQKNELKPFNNQGNNIPKNDNFRPKPSKKSDSTSNNRAAEKPQGAKGKKSDGTNNNKQDKPAQQTKQFEKLSKQMSTLFGAEEDLQLSQEYEQTTILRSGWECSSCGKLNWWLRKFCKACADQQFKPFERMKQLSPGELQQFDYLFFMDYECNQNYNRGFEIIEFPIVVIDVKLQKIIDTYETFVKPESKITKFITKLTTITNQDVAKAPNLRNTILNVTEFLKIYTQDLSTPDRCAVVYDNRSDADFLWNETTAKKIKLPEILTTYINIKDVFPVIFSTPPRAPKSLADMQDILKLSFEGTKHRGVDDATNQANVGVECLIRGYEFKKDMLVSINPAKLPKAKGQKDDSQLEVIIHLEFDVEKDPNIIEEESKEEDEIETKRNQEMEKDEDEENKNQDKDEDDDKEDNKNNNENAPNNNNNTKKKTDFKGKDKKPKSLNIDSIRSCSFGISQFDPKTKQFYLSSHGLLTIKMFDGQNKNESKKINESNSQEQATVTQEQLKVFQHAAIQIASFIQLESSQLKSKRTILMTSNLSHKLTTQLFLDSCSQISQKEDSEIDLAARILVLHLNHFTFFKKELYETMRYSHNAQRFQEQFKQITSVMADFGRKSAEQKIQTTIEIWNSLVNVTGKCRIERDNVKKVF